METEVQSARAISNKATDKLHSSDAHAPKYSVLAKRFLDDTAFTLENDALQTYADYGYLSDHGIERIVRNTGFYQRREGANEVMTSSLVITYLTNR